MVPLVPGLPMVSMLQEMTDMVAAGGEAAAAGDMAAAAGDMAMMGKSTLSSISPTINCAAAGTPALMLLSTFLPGLGIGLLKGMLFSKFYPSYI